MINNIIFKKQINEIVIIASFVFLIATTGIMDNLVGILDSPMASITNYIKISTLLSPILIFFSLALKKNNIFIKDKFLRSIIFFVLFISTLEIIHSIFYLSNNIDFTTEYLKFYITLGYALEWGYVCFAYYTLSLFLDEKIKKNIISILVLISIIYSFYVIIGKINYNFFYQNNIQHTIFNRKFPLSEHYSFFFVFALNLPIFFNCEIMKNIFFKVIFIILIFYTIFISSSHGALLCAVSLIPIWILYFLLNIKNNKYKIISFTIVFIVFLLLIISFIYFDPYLKKYILFILKMTDLNIINYIFFPDHLGGKEHSAIVRYNSFLDSFKLIKHNLLFGNGILLNSLNQYMGSSSHQNILYPISAYGIFGLFLYINMIVNLFNKKFLNLKTFFYIFSCAPCFFGVQIFNDHIPIYFGLIFFTIVKFNIFNQYKL